ncbi:MAG: succinate dehydrogenase, cytochrome b556 subunit [Pseudomonadota bacterium]
MSTSRPRHALHWAHWVHRLSGVALAVFLPLHLWVLSLALTDPAAFEQAIAFAEHPLVKLAETGLVGLLALHLIGGLRLLALETLGWTGSQKRVFTVGCLAAAGLATLFLISATR